MAQQLAPRLVAPSVCSQAPYALFSPLVGFAPAETFCSIYQAQSTLPPTSGCPKGNALCSVLSSLSNCDRAFISTECACIEATSTTTISVPKSTTPSATKITAKSSSSQQTSSHTSSVKSNPHKECALQCLSNVNQIDLSPEFYYLPSCAVHRLSWTQSLRDSLAVSETLIRMLGWVSNRSSRFMNEGRRDTGSEDKAHVKNKAGHILDSVLALR